MQKHKSKQVPRADNVEVYETPQRRARRLLTEQAHRDAFRLTYTFDVQHDHLPALRSVIEEMGDMLAARLGGKKNTPEQEQAYTAATVAIGILRGAIFPTVAEGDPHYRSEHA